MLDAKVLGQLLLMQSVVVNLPDTDSIFSFVCRGLLDLPGVVDVKHVDVAGETLDETVVKYPLLIEESNFGEIQLTVNDSAAFTPYSEYLENFIFMIKIILEERNQRQQNLLHQTMLEKHVKERTEQLSNEIKERKHAEKNLRIALTKYKTLFSTIPIGVTVTSETGKILEANKYAEKLLGISQEIHTRRDIDGAEWHIIRPDGSIMPAEEFASVRALKEGRLVENVEMGVVKPNGEITWMSATADLLPLDGYGVVIAYSDISERKQAEENLKQLLMEKEILLAEVHHRVKNNLQVVASLLNLQTEGLEDERILKFLQESHARIQSMTLVHEQLYRSKEYARIEFGTYIDQLATSLFNLYQINPDRVRLKLVAENIFIDLERAIPCGLLINELMTNSLKYAFPGERRGKITVVLQEKADEMTLRYHDDGVGLPPSFDLEKVQSLGLQLVRLLVVHDPHGIWEI